MEETLFRQGFFSSQKKRESFQEQQVLVDALHFPSNDTTCTTPGALLESREYTVSACSRTSQPCTIKNALLLEEEIGENFY